VFLFITNYSSSIISPYPPTFLLTYPPTFLLTFVIGTLFFLIARIDHEASALGAFIARRSRPQGEFTFGILVAGVKSFFGFGFFSDNFSLAAFGAGNARVLVYRFGVFTFWESAAGHKFAKSSLADEHWCSAFFTFDIGHFRFLPGFLWCSCGLATAFTKAVSTPELFGIVALGKSAAG
jgi:hypothetical protein